MADRNMNWIGVKTLESRLVDCGLELKRDDELWSFRSHRARFHPFRIAGSIEQWDLGEGPLTAGGYSAHVPDTAVRIWFSGGSLLLVFPTGHIRWMPKRAYRCFSIMTDGKPALYCQGDVVVHSLPSGEWPACSGRLSSAMPTDTSDLWCPAVATRDEPVGVWRFTNNIPVGGNRRHMAIGPMRVRFPWAADKRCVQIHTLGTTRIEHNPTDAVHPIIELEASRDFLVGKLPGFSDPAAELPSYRGYVQ
jgi:hypothetical protein